MNESIREKLYQKRTGRIDMVLDTDTFNEVDDQYAISYILHSPDRLNLCALYAAPFQNAKAETAAIGMQKSYDEIFNILRLNGREDLFPIVYKGSTEYLPDEKTPVDSPAARDMVERSKNYTADNPLYITAIGAITNVASAILMDPTIIERCVFIWLGGNCRDWHDYHEFNLQQDVAGARVWFGCGGAMIQIPAYGVTSALTCPMQEAEYWLGGEGELCEYLLDITLKEMKEKLPTHVGSRKIWDISSVAYLLDEKGDVAYEKFVTAPIPAYDHSFTLSDDRPLIKQVYYLDRDKIFRDLFRKLVGRQK